MSTSNSQGRRYRFSVHGQPSRYGWAARRRAERLRRRTLAIQPTGSCPTLAAIADQEYLLSVLRQLRQEGGKAPGPDHVTYADLSRADEGHVCRELARLLRDGQYRPSEPRRVSIPKAAGGFRTLSLRTVADRIVADACKRIIEPGVDAVFLPNNHGFRRGRSVYQMLAAVNADIVQHGRRVLLVDDVRKAFDNVRIDHVMQFVAQHINDPGLLRLIEVILRGGDHPDGHPVGIDQGSALSPLILNLQLHYALDLPMRAQAELPVLHRYADNLCAACRTEEEAGRVLDRIRQSLQTAEHTLKGTGGGIFQMEEGHQVELLGYLIQIANGQVQFRIPEEAYGTLRERLEEVWATNQPVKNAKAVIAGWIRSYGPVYEERDQNGAIQAVQAAAEELALGEAVDIPGLLENWNRARASWNRTLERAMTGSVREAC